MSSIPPPPPPAPIPPPTPQAQRNTPPPPTVPPTGPKDSLLLELHIFNGHPFKDHWAYWISSPDDPLIGDKIHATGDVRSGFIFEIKRSHNLRTSPDIPTKRIPLQWVDGKYFDQKLMEGPERIENVPGCAFERILHDVKVPGKSLNSVGEEGGLGENGVGVGRRVVQRDCQTWIVESMGNLVREGVIGREMGEFVCSIRQ